ncbi:PLP-dependent aminotransferase family protein, partial [Candidatus Fermentibacteria bacterium]|nr:PLP-dependent aminotransferase family protein [Candidatus Fermentibacteria bacterium]
MVILKLERNGSIPLHRQITDGLRRLIDEGSLPIGSRLPPTRGFAENLGVNRATVYRAYEELWSLGYLEGRPGSYTRVRGRAPLSRSEMTPDSGSIRWESRVSHEGSEALRTFLKFSPEGRSVTPDTVDFSHLDMDESLIPVDAFRRCLNTVLRRDGARLLRYGARAGHELLREQIARRLRVHGIHVCADEIFIANGSQHALDLLIRTLADPSRGVVVEAPTYAMMLPLLRLHGVPAIPVPMREDGMDLDLLEGALSRPVAFVYTMPN